MMRARSSDPILTQTFGSNVPAADTSRANSGTYTPIIKPPPAAAPAFRNVRRFRVDAMFVSPLGRRVLRSAATADFLSTLALPDGWRDGCADRCRSGRCCPTSRCRYPGPTVSDSWPTTRRQTSAARTGSSRIAAPASAIQASCNAWLAFGDRPSIVVIFFPATPDTAVSARADRRPIDVHRAGAALRDSAAELRARQSQCVSNDPEQRGLGTDVHVVPLVIHDQNHDGLLF